MSKHISNLIVKNLSNTKPQQHVKKDAPNNMLKQTLLEVAEKKVFEGQKIVVPKGCEDAGFVAGVYNLTDVLKTVANAIK